MAREFTREEDLAVLEVIDAASKGEKRRDIISRLGVTRGQISGTMSRFRETADIPCKCRRRANKNGGMADRWWAA